MLKITKEHVQNATIFVKRHVEIDINIYTHPYILFLKSVHAHECKHTHTYAHINTQIQKKVWKDLHQ